MQDYTTLKQNAALIRDNVTKGSNTASFVGQTIHDLATHSEENNASFIDYNHAGDPISLDADTWTDIPNDGAGAFSNNTYAPINVDELIDVTTGYINVSDLSLGDSILIRNDYSVNPNTNNSLLEFRYVLGNGGGEYTLEKTVGRLDSGSGKNYRFSLEPDLIYMGDDNTRLNPIKLQAKLSTSGILTNAGSVIQTV